MSGYNPIHAAASYTLMVMLTTIAGCAAAERGEGRVAPDPQAIVSELAAATYEPFDLQHRDDAAYTEAYIARRDATVRRRLDLIWQLYEVDPYHEQLPHLMAERWQWQPDGIDRSAQVRRELDMFIANHRPDTPLGAEARYIKASLTAEDAMLLQDTPEVAVTAWERFMAEVPHDPRPATALLSLANAGYEHGSAEHIALLQRVIDVFANHEANSALRAVRNAQSQIDRLNAIGEPFDYSFTCAVTGAAYDPAVLAGKVVVIDFWATWCGPCVAELPKLQTLYRKYRQRGVEFIGVSLDFPIEEGGLQSLLTFIEEHDLPWPQWYLGDWDHPFPAKWGVSSIPSLFIVDAEGRLRSTNARNQLEALIIKLLAERDAAAPTS